jgi:hypothetical protein
MRKILLALLSFWLASSSAAFPVTDQQCMSDCLGKGYLYGLCQSRCSYDPSPQPAPQQQPYIVPINPTPPKVWQYTPPQTDFKCVKDCKDLGYKDDFCLTRCSH